MAYTFFTDSPPATGTPLTLEGVWIHDPRDASGTARQYRYGKDVRSGQIDIKGAPLNFAGRRFPVTEFGEHQEDTYAITMHVPNGETYQAELGDLRGFAEARRTLVVRDNRGRSVHGTLSGYSVDDQAWGAAVSFGVARVHVGEVTT